jgi:hypothetical protein
MPHVDVDKLAWRAGAMPQLRCGESGRGNARLRRDPDTERGRQNGFTASEFQAIKRSRVSGRRLPKVGDDFGGRAQAGRGWSFFHCGR